MQVLGGHKFHLLAFHVIQGNQVIVRGEKRKIVESVLNCLKVRDTCKKGYTLDYFVLDSGV